MKSLHDLRVNYDSEPLQIEKMAKSPLEQFLKWFEEVEKKDISDCNAASLSTIQKSTLQIHSRMVLIKEITKDGIVFFTNYGSLKAKDIESCPNVALNIYWPSFFRQVRIDGLARKISESRSDEYFKSRPRESQVAAIISIQSLELTDRSKLESDFQQLLDSGSELKRPDYWGGYEVVPTCAEFWQGRSHRLHDRVLYKMGNKSKDEWERVRLYP